jgi:hypothetical protein
MPKYCPENERVKRDYAFFLQAASGKQDATIDAALRAIERFETSTGRKPFGKFHVEQARSFRAGLVEQMGRNGHPLSAATITATLKHQRNFFLWLSREPGFRSKLNANDANYFTPSEQDRRIAGARREGPVPSLEEVMHVLRAAGQDGDREAKPRRDRLYHLDRRPGWRAGVLSVEARQPGRRDSISGRPRGEHEAPKDLRDPFFPGRPGAPRHRVGLHHRAHKGAGLRPR